MPNFIESGKLPVKNSGIIYCRMAGWEVDCLHWGIQSGGGGQLPRDVHLVPNSFIFIQFSAKKNRLAHPL